MIERVKSPLIRPETSLYSVDIECSLLGIILLEKDAILQIIEFLKPHCFYNNKNQKIYMAILTLFREGLGIDVHTVAEQLSRSNDLEKIGGMSYLTELTYTIASATHIKQYVDIINKKAMRRALLVMIAKLTKKVYEAEEDIYHILDEAGQSLYEILQTNIKKPYHSIGHLIEKVARDFKEKKFEKDAFFSGFESLDEIIGEWPRGEVVGLGGRPGMGKTALLLEFAYNTASLYKKAVAFFSLEMEKTQLMYRIFAARTGLVAKRIEQGKLNPFEWQQFYSEIEKLKNMPIFFDDTAALSLFEFRAKCRQLKIQKNVELIIIDYLQLMKAYSSHNSREQEISSIVMGLKAVAKELNLTIIAASQLSRAAKIRENKRPQLSDLRDSGSLEQTFSIVLFLYRESYYQKIEGNLDNAKVGLTELIVSKNRNGPLGTAYLHFDATFTRFKDFKKFVPPQNIIERESSYKIQ